MVYNCKYCNCDVDAHLEAEYAKYEVRISHIKTATPEELIWSVVNVRQFLVI